MNNNHRSSSSSARDQHGLTLVEILVALVISLFLMAGVIQLFVGTKQTYRFHDALSRIQENGRFALDVMAVDIRMASYQFPPALFPTPFNQNNPVEGIGNEIRVRWNDNDPRRRFYSIGPRTGGGAAPTCPTAGTSLFLQRDNDVSPQELIEGVEDMQLLYGVCADVNNDGIIDGPPTNYVNAAGVGDANWHLVCSVRIHLLLVSLENNIVSEPQAYFFPMSNAVSQTPADRCLRQAFSTTVAIRNRIP